MQNYYVQFRIFYQYVHKYTILIKYVKIYKLIWTVGGSRLLRLLDSYYCPTHEKFNHHSGRTDIVEARRQSHTLQGGSTNDVHSRLKKVC